MMFKVSSGADWGNCLKPEGLHMRIKDLSVAVADVYSIPPDNIIIDPDFNVRTDTPEFRAHVQQLADSIINSGYNRTRPLTVRMPHGATENKVILVDGHCRLLAVRLAIAAGQPIESIPCVAEGRGVSEADRALMLLTSNNGLPLTPLEQAKVVKRLLSYGWDEKKIGAAIGRTRQHIASLLELAAAPEGVKAMVANSVVSASEAVKAIRADRAGALKTLKAAEAVAKAQGRSRVTPAIIAQVRPEPVEGRVIVPLETAARHVVDMAKGERLSPALRRAIDALHESLT